MGFTRWITRLLRIIFKLPTVHSLSIAKETLQDISEMSRSAHPKEMLAFLSTSLGNKQGHMHIDELQLQAYFASEDSASVMLSNLPMTTSIIGTVHSHPGGNKRPSDADLTLFSKFGYLHAIIGEPYRVQDIRFYDKTGALLQVEVR